MRPVLVSLSLSLEGSEETAVRCIVEVSSWGPPRWGLILLDLDAEPGIEVEVITGDGDVSEKLCDGSCGCVTVVGSGRFHE